MDLEKERMTIFKPWEQIYEDVRGQKWDWLRKELRDPLWSRVRDELAYKIMDKASAQLKKEVGK